MLGFDAFYRAWRESDERIVLNAVLYPAGAAIPADTAAPKRIAPASDALAISALPAVRSRPLKAVDKTARDVRIRVKRKDGVVLRRAVNAGNRRRHPGRAAQETLRLRPEGHLLGCPNPWPSAPLPVPPGRLPRGWRGGSPASRSSWASSI